MNTTNLKDNPDGLASDTGLTATWASVEVPWREKMMDDAGPSMMGSAEPWRTTGS